MIQWIKPSHEIISYSHTDIISAMELVGRNAYKSEDKITPESGSKFIKMILNKNHTGILEHCSITIRFITSRSISHELVRHRIASYVEQSQRYINFNKIDSIKCIIPLDIENSTPVMLQLFKDSVTQSIDSYRILVENKIKPQISREVLPNCFYTDVIATFNFRSLRNMLNLRCDETAHPEMRRLMIPLLVELYNKYPVLFQDIYDKVKLQNNIF